MNENEERQLRELQDRLTYDGIFSLCLSVEQRVILVNWLANRFGLNDPWKFNPEYKDHETH